MTAMPSVIECEKLSRDFRGAGGIAHALTDVSFRIGSGELVGLLGPDGAGKTTLLRLLCGLLKPTSGSASVLGFDTMKGASGIQSRIGYMPQKFGLYENLSVEENMRLYSDLNLVTEEARKKRFAELFDLTRLGPFKNRQAGNLSGGMKQKLALACALVSRPPLMLLDEPTVGVDVLSRRELWAILKRISGENGATTILVSTTYMDEADYCGRTLTLFEGKLLSDLPPAKVRELAAGKSENPTFEQGFQVLISGSVPPPLRRKNPVRPDSPVMVRAEHLVKKFGSFTAVNDVSFDVRKGEIFGLLGANGAGKTTTFRMLCGLSAADGGTVSVAGFDLRHSGGGARAKLGYMAQKFSLYCDISVLDNMEFFGGAYGLSGDRLKKRIAWALRTFDLEAFRNANTGKLPLGYKQRLGMACALIHEPEVLFLDEATSGADPMARRDFWERIMAFADSGVAVVATTHFLDEARYCDRMVIMQDGVAAASGTGDEIRAKGSSPDLETAFVNIISEGRKAVRS